MQLGATFSHHELEYLGIAPFKAAKAYSDLNFNWVRLAFYWNEPSNTLDQLINYFSKKNIKIILAFGMKAPRWPEFYIPKKFSKSNPQNENLQKDLIKTLHKLINKYKNNNCIKIWQIENEPLDPAGPNGWSINFSFLKKEVELIKSLDPSRQILLTLWGNELSKRSKYKKLIQLADIIGLDIYLTRYDSNSQKYFPPDDSLQKINSIIKSIKSKNKKVWITELQAEPWEKDHYKFIHDFPSFPPINLSTNFNYIKKLEPEVVLFWGFEFWLFQRNRNDHNYWDAIEALQNSLNSHPC